MTILLCDAGGTFLRFALAGQSGVGAAQVYESAAFPDFETAALAFLDGVQPEASAIAAAGPCINGAVTLTNGPRFIIEPGRLKQATGARRALVVNDFAALAAGAAARTPAPEDVLQAGVDDPRGTVLVIGPGTGLGAAAVLPASGPAGPRVLAGEGGHAGLSPVSDREIAVLFQLMRRFGHVKAEAVLSGPGLELLYETLGALDGAATARLTAGEITARAASRKDARAEETLALFTAWLGGFAGDAALITGASGGVRLAGGVLRRMAGAFDRAAFLRRFNAKGGHRPYMERMRVSLALDETACFEGLISLLAAEDA